MEGLRSFDFGQWQEALMLFAAASRAQPVEGEWIRPYGMRYEPYLPHFHLGVCLYRLGKYDEALARFAESERQGAIRERRNRAWYRTLEELRARLQRDLETTARKLTDEVAAAGEQLLALRQSDLFAAADSEDLVVAERIEELLASAGDEAAGTFSTQALRRREEQVETIWNELAALVDRLDRRQKKTTDAGEAVPGETPRAPTQDDAARQRELETALARYLDAVARIRLGECGPEVVQLLEEAQAVLAPARLRGSPTSPRLLPSGVPFTPNLELARAYSNCRDIPMVERYARRAVETDRADTASDPLATWARQHRQRQRYSGSYALLIAAYAYRNGWEPLDGPQDDVRELRRALEKHGFEVEIVENPDSRNLERTIKEFIARRGTDPGHRLLFYYAGHGWTETNYGVHLGYVVPVDATHPREDPAALTYLVSMDDFEGYAKEIRARHAVFLFDSCFAGTIFAATKASIASHLSREEVDHLAALPVRLFITAGDASDEVPDQSLFRRAVVEALEGAADVDRDGVILGSEIGAYVQREVSAVTRTLPQWGKMEVGEFGLGDIAFSGPDPLSTPDAARLELIADLASWKALAESENPADYRGYLARYPEGHFAVLAQLILERLEGPGGDGGGGDGGGD